MAHKYDASRRWQLLPLFAIRTHLVAKSSLTNCSTSSASTPLAIAAVVTCTHDFRWTTINLPARFCSARRREVKGDAMDGRTVFAAFASTSHSLALGRG